jgi:hypothetical protein
MTRNNLYLPERMTQPTKIPNVRNFFIQQFRSHTNPSFRIVVIEATKTMNKPASVKPLNTPPTISGNTANTMPKTHRNLNGQTFLCTGQQLHPKRDGQIRPSPHDSKAIECLVPCHLHGAGVTKNRWQELCVSKAPFLHRLGKA